MPIQSSVSSDGATLTMLVDGRFDATCLDDFRQCYEESSEINKYVIDLKGTQHLDSSALGMLLVLRDFAGGNDANIQIINCTEDVKKIFAISAFSQLFDIQ